VQQLCTTLIFASGWKTPCSARSSQELGFHYSTKSGISIGIDDMLIPSNKYSLVENAEKEVVKVQQQYLDGPSPTASATQSHRDLGRRHRKVADELFKALENQDKEGIINPVYVMATLARAVRNSRFVSFPVCAA